MQVQQAGMGEDRHGREYVVRTADPRGEPQDAEQGQDDASSDDTQTNVQSHLWADIHHRGHEQLGHGAKTGCDSMLLTVVVQEGGSMRVYMCLGRSD